MSNSTPEFVLEGEAGRYRLGGVADYANARRLLEAGRQRLGGDARAELDLSGLTALDSAGLAVLIAWLGEARAAGRELSYRGMPGPLLPTARVAGVESLVAADAR